MASFKHWSVLLLLAFIWGSSFILIKRSLFTATGEPVFSPAQVGALRISIAALVMLPVALRYRQHLTRRNTKFFLIVGVCGNALPAFLFALAQTRLPSALTGILNATTPLFSVLLALIVFRVPVISSQILGLLLGLFATVGLLQTGEALGGGDVHVGYALLVLLATLCYGISLNSIKQYLQDVPAVAITALALLLVSPLGIAAAALTDVSTTLVEVEGAGTALLYVSTLATCGTALALVLFNKLVQDTNTVFASSVTYLIPLTATLWGVIDGEQLRAEHFLFAGLMIFGVLLMNSKKRIALRKRNL